MPDASDRQAMIALAATLENSFYGLDRQAILDRIRRREETAIERSELSALCGITEGRVLDLLVDLDITPESLAALALAPLVLVAWADGRVDGRERKAVLQAAREAGVAEGSASHELLSFRLDDPPDPALVRAWAAYAAVLTRTLPADELATFKEQTLSRARRVAEASRGFLGLGPRVSEAERDVLDRLEAAFG
jgi:hypothetical protein